VDRVRNGRLSAGRRADGGRDAAPALASAVPIAVCVVVLIAGALRFTAWKAHHLAAAGRHRGAAAYCRRTPARPGDTACASASTAILLVIGVTDLRAMAVVTAAITVERLAPAGERVARATGAVAVGAGLFLIARAAGLG